ncbi:translation protein SH3-like domain-containing protein [Mycotypha africana]|uniref:translation protein SH3-like domain-containing protein n=1 Tax=Mycotypha africana TaxID=64632 RepID=UPI0023005828|nr:translation protein SH3-like domain-containing protein [Mycotypha africana]KAI8967111.1 translation protein SH3-like domain-containing protein [Mycotypha africana]
MHRVRPKGVSSRVYPATKSIKPQNKITKWNIVSGDKVAIIAGRDKDTIGEVKSVDRKTNTLFVEGKKLAKKHVPMQPAAPEGIVRKEMPIHYSNVMLLHPDTQLPTKIDRRKVSKTLEDGRVITRWSRFVKGTDIEIPKPFKKYNDIVQDEKFTTTADEVLRVTYTSTPTDAAQPPFPQELVKELRNVHKKKLIVPLDTHESSTTSSPTTPTAGKAKVSPST